MSLSDDLMLRYYALLSMAPAEQQRAIRDGAVHPMEAKKSLASELVTRFHDADAASGAARFFEERFQKRTAHEPIEVRLVPGTADVWICKLLKDVGFAASTSEARRLVAQGGVRVDGQPVDVDFKFRPGSHRLLEVGRRRVAQISVEESGR